MLLIVTAITERTSDEVIKWLICNNTPFVRISAHSRISIMNFIINNDYIDFDIYSAGKFVIKYSQISFYWYRRDHIAFVFDGSLPKKLSYLKSSINRYLNDEIKTFTDFINYLLKLKPSLNSFKDNALNKLEVLEKAKSIGLIIPNTFIISHKKELNKILNKHSIITKPACQGVTIQRRTTGLDSSTVQFFKKDLKEVSSLFHPSLVQHKLYKKYELRIFYLNSKLYSSAIFSQQNKKTMIDFRNYDSELPNRVIPFKLPLNISKKLKKLFKILTLTSGSVDMVVTTRNEFVFLEINPIGQFQQVSYPCNYYLEKKMAQYLSKKL